MKTSKTLLLAVGALAAWAILLGNLGAQPRRDTKAVLTRVAVCDVATVFNNYKRAEDKETRVERWDDAYEAKRIIEWAIDYYRKNELK